MRFAKLSNMLEIFSRSLTALIAAVSESYKRSHSLLTLTKQAKELSVLSFIRSIFP